MRIEIILTESITPRILNYGIRLKRLESVAMFASFLWGGICVVGYVAKDAAAEWVKRKIITHQ
jgi:hypothetical protein